MNFLTRIFLVNRVTLFEFILFFMAYVHIDSAQHPAKFMGACLIIGLVTGLLKYLSRIP